MSPLPPHFRLLRHRHTVEHPHGVTPDTGAEAATCAATTRAVRQAAGAADVSAKRNWTWTLRGQVWRGV